MPFVNGQDLSESDFIAASSGAADVGKAPKLNTNGLLDPSFLSFSQSEVHASRAIGTNYQNLTGHTLMVVVSTTNNSAVYGLKSYIGATSPAASLYSEAQIAGSVGSPLGLGCILLIVPKNYYYRVDFVSNSSITIDAWWEAQLPF